MNVEECWFEADVLVEAYVSDAAMDLSLVRDWNPGLEFHNLETLGAHVSPCEHVRSCAT